MRSALSDSCPEFYRAQSRAIAAVQRAKQLGLLPALSTCKCVDCGAQATIYDHRDYDQPLQVDPVCQRCNLKRGRAAWTVPIKLHRGGVARMPHFQVHFDAMVLT